VNTARMQCLGNSVSVRSQAVTLITIGLLATVLSSCGGSNASSSPQNPDQVQFMLASGNWVLELPDGASAGGSLIQTGNAISGVLYIYDSPCFDPVKDKLIVSGTVSNDGSYTLTFSSSPIRGQVLTVNGFYDVHNGGLDAPTPSGPQYVFGATIIITGGACAGQLYTQDQWTEPKDYSMAGAWDLNDTPPNSGKAVFTEGLPNASGVSPFTGTFTFTLANPPCFSSGKVGTVSSGTVLGDSVEMTVHTDSGDLVGSGTFINLGKEGASVSFDFTVQGGPCDGSQFNALFEAD
jgi:hypothetical protein